MAVPDLNQIEKLLNTSGTFVERMFLPNKYKIINRLLNEISKIEYEIELLSEIVDNINHLFKDGTDLQGRKFSDKTNESWSSKIIRLEKSKQERIELIKIMSGNM